MNRNSQKSKIGLFGGAFDPVNNGHVGVVQNVEKYFDEVWVMPTYDHTFGKKMTPGKNRLAMCELAFEYRTDVHAYVSPFEISRKLTGGTYEVLKALSDFHPDYEFTMIIGSDNLLNIQKWKNWEKLTAEFSFLVLNRKGYDIVLPQVGAKIQRLTGALEVEIVEYSSTAVRNEIANGKRPEYIDPLVYDYIKSHNLYGA